MRKILITLLMCLALCSFVVGCDSALSIGGSSKTKNKSSSTVASSNLTTSSNLTASGGTATSSGNATSSEESQDFGFEVTFSTDEHVKVYVFDSQDYDGDGELSTVAYSRDGSSGKLLSDGNGQVNFKVICDDGFEVLAENIVVEGNYKNLKTPTDTAYADLYRITKISGNLTVKIKSTEKSSTSGESSESGGNSESVDIEAERQKAENLGLTIVNNSGTADCYTVSGTTVTFGTISQKTVYAISGKLDGNIVINVGDGYAFELSLAGVTITSAEECPIAALSGDKVTISAKKGTENFIYDNRIDVSGDDAAFSSAIYSAVDLAIQGNGSLTVESAKNNGIHTKDDLTVKNLTLKVNCVDNALKGNDSVTIESGTIELIATGGDCIKTSNSDISSKGNQRGTVAVNGGTINLYAACDGIDAAYDVQISGESTSLTIKTDSYSTYTKEIKKSSKTEMYLLVQTNSNNYRYAVCFYNSDTDYEWQNAQYYGTARGNNGRTNYYVYSLTRPTKYQNFMVYRFTSAQENSFDAYSAATSGATVNDSSNAYILSSSSNSKTMTGSWTTLSTSSNDTYSSKGIKANNAIVIGGGTIDIQATDDCIHVDYGETLENGLTGIGTITISGGNITLETKDDAIHSDYKLSITDGLITVKSCYEGLEANLIEIGGGTIYVSASDDGVNAAGTVTTPCITISGGYLDVTVGTGDVDGIDSNGNYVQTGGFVVTRDATSMTGGTASGLDLDGTCTITGGTLVCVGAIAQTPSSSSECYVIFGGSSSSAGGGYMRPGGSMGGTSSSTKFTSGTYTVSDGSGNELFTFTLSTTYTGMWIASDKFIKGGSYTLTNGTTTKTWSQSSNSVSVS